VVRDLCGLEMSGGDRRISVAEAPGRSSLSSVRRFVMRQLLACMALCLFLGADAPKDDVKKDKDKLQGTWKTVTVQEDGEKKDDTEDHRLIFSGDEFCIKKGDETVIKGKFKIDSSKKPKQIDMDITQASKEEFEGKTAVGIYELDGDTLKWCVKKPGKGERPKEFASDHGSSHLLVTFKREKAK
jgi:uncharacterized protein (TIGR03067 family)